MTDEEKENLMIATRDEITLSMNGKSGLDFYVKFNAVVFIEELMAIYSKKIIDKQKQG